MRLRYNKDGEWRDVRTDAVLIDHASERDRVLVSRSWLVAVDCQIDAFTTIIRDHGGRCHLETVASPLAADLEMREVLAASDKGAT